MRPIQPVIMSGGAGTRLWPLSRARKPKQFLKLASDRTLFQEALLRVKPAPGEEFVAPVVIGGAAHAGLIAGQAKEIGARLAAIVLEPFARNTAAVAAVAAEWTLRSLSKALVLLLPADHHIADAARFRQAVAGAASAADRGIVTFGIRPTEPTSGFGYVETGAPAGPGLFKVAGFHEKPPPEIAMALIEGGRHVWNAGIFLYDPQTMLEEMDRHARDIRASAAAALSKARSGGPEIHLDADLFAGCRSDSVDFAVMEKTDKAFVAGPLDIGWSDIGSWSAVAAPADDRGLAIECNETLIVSDGPLVGVVGVEGLVVVATKDAVLVVPKSRAQDVKTLVEELKARGRDDLL